MTISDYRMGRTGFINCCAINKPHTPIQERDFNEHQSQVMWSSTDGHFFILLSCRVWSCPRYGADRLTGDPE
jgi:hypothetical protein